MKATSLTANRLDTEGYILSMSPVDPILVNPARITAIIRKNSAHASPNKGNANPTTKLIIDPAMIGVASGNFKLISL